MVKTKMFFCRYYEGNKITLKDGIDKQLNEYILNNNISDIIDVKFAQDAVFEKDGDVWVYCSALLMYKI